jgi:anaerobic ribonucleoside-triphosphate reductase activating protein
MGSVLRIAAIVESTAAEGPHDRFAVWVQGCALRCPGCCNPEMFDEHGGFPTEVGDLLSRIEHAQRRGVIEGLTILGGEPLQQTEAVTALARGSQALGLGVLVFSGLRFERARALPGFDRLWRQLDTLVDGPFVADQLEPPDGRRFVGSRNQRILHRTRRYADPSLWSGPRRMQVDIDARGRSTLTGFPIPVSRLQKSW